MNIQRIAIALLWLVTVVAAYFIGGNNETIPGTPAANTASAHAGGDTGNERGPREVVRKQDGSEDDPGHREKANIPMLIAKARVEMGSGMGGMMNMRGMLRAIAPIIELDDSQIQEALAEVEKSIKEPQQRMMFYSILLGQWAEKDGKAALDYADKSIKDNPMFGMGIKASIIGSWARTNPDAAWRWYESEGKNSGDGRNGMMAISSLFAGLAAKDLDAAIAKLDTIEESQRSVAISGLAMSGMSGDARQRLLDRSASLPATTRDAIRQSTLGQWAMMEPEAAMKYLQTLPAEEQKPLRANIAQNMMMMNPKQGAELLLKDATDEEKPRIYDQAIGQWAYQDPKAAGQWLTQQPQGPELDNARMTFATIVAQKEPATAMDWAKSVTKPELREQSIGHVYTAWKGRDPNAAEAALNGSGLSTAAIENVRKMVSRANGEEATLMLSTPAVRTESKPPKR